MQRLKQFLSDAEMTQADFAAKVGVAQPTVWEWLNGRSKPKSERLLVIAEVTGLTVEDLLRDSA